MVPKPIKQMFLHRNIQPFEDMAKKGLGTIAFQDSWDIFDQIMVSQSLIQNNFSSFIGSGIYNKSFLYKLLVSKDIKTSFSYGSGFSDHFPVYIYLIKG
jgi:hypothetical protein